jgi:hypothetical protein
MIKYRNLLLFSALLLLIGALHTANAETNKTFFMPRSVGQDSVLRYSNYEFFVNNFAKAKCFTLTNTVFFQQSTNGRELGKYFFPNNKTELTVKGSLAGGCDVSGTWLQIAGRTNPPNPKATELYLNQFSSTISIKPQIESFGDILKLHVPFSVAKINGWFAFEFPFMQVETNCKLNEYNLENNFNTIEEIEPFTLADRQELAKDFTPLNAAQGLNNPTWHYGKFKNGIQKLAGLADIGVYAGITPVEQKNYSVDCYLKGTLPTSYKPKAEYVCEPILGSAHHWGIGCGADANFKLIDKQSCLLSLATKLELNYLFESTETRSFDLTNGPWSRYLMVFRPGVNGHQMTDPIYPLFGINFFTKQLKVSPGVDLNWLTSLSLKDNNFYLEAGYNFWCKQKEDVKLRNSWNNQDIAIAGLTFTEGDYFGGQSFSNAIISTAINSVPFDNATIYVKQNNLNLNSAAHPSQITNKFYLNVGYNYKYKKNPLLISVGSSYEFADQNKSLEQWGLMLQFSTNF